MGVAAEQRASTICVRTSTLAELYERHYGRRVHRKTVWWWLRKLEERGFVKYIPERKQVSKGRWIQLPSKIILLDKLLKIFKGLVRVVGNTVVAFQRVALTLKGQLERRVKLVFPSLNLPSQNLHKGRGGILEALCR